MGALCLTAYASKIQSSVTPASLEAHGFSLKVENRTDGNVEFTVIRDLSKAKQFPATSGLQVSRFGTLRVSGESGFLAQCNLAPDLRERGVISYRFTISRDSIARSTFVLAEDDDYQDQTRERLIGGGTHFSFALALFAKDQAP